MTQWLRSHSAPPPHFSALLITGLLVCRMRILILCQCVRNSVHSLREVCHGILYKVLKAHGDQLRTALSRQSYQVSLSQRLHQLVKVAVPAPGIDHNRKGNLIKIADVNPRVLGRGMPEFRKPRERYWSLYFSRSVLLARQDNTAV
jgi:hypothetical protein